MTNAEAQDGSRRIGVLWRGSQSEEDWLEQARLRYVLQALDATGLTAVPVVYEDERVDEVRQRLLQLDGVLVWVDPITDGRDRSVLDPVLREVAAQGVWVSAHPDVVLKMGTKDVLVSTRDMGWGTDCYLYGSLEELRQQLPSRLLSGPRVLKQHRGNGGNGVWKVEPVVTGATGPSDVVSVLHAQRASALEEMGLDQFVTRCAPYFAGSGCMIDQPYQVRLGEGMVRCYLVHDRVAGFGHQYVTALLPPPAGTRQSPLPPPRLYYGPGKPEFQALKTKLEQEWVPEMQQVLALDAGTLPALWDADFLLGPKTAAGEDSYVLCEVNVSSVLPFPDEALEPLVAAVARRLKR